MSPAKLAANQNNAKLSTGPRTDEGKQTSSRNATRHGLTSKAALLPWEDRAEYEALHAAFRKDHRPASEFETELLRAMADAWWRLQRAHRVETEFLIEREADIRNSGAGVSGDTALALLFSDEEQSRKMRLVMRYTESAERAWRKAQSDWEKARAAASQQALEDAAAEIESENEQATAAAAHGGFVRFARRRQRGNWLLPGSVLRRSSRLNAGSTGPDLHPEQRCLSLRTLSL
jgi:hypothetical protein